MRDASEILEVRFHIGLEETENYKGYVIHVRKDNRKDAGNYFRYSYDKHGIAMSNGWVGMYTSNKSIILALAKASIDTQIAAYPEGSYKIWKG